MSVRDQWKIKLQKMNKWVSRLACEKQPTKKPHVKHMTRRWRVVPGCNFHDWFAGKANPQRTCESLCLAKSYVFQRENPRKYTWELEIIIPTIIYTFPCIFPLLLPLHIQIIERLIAQTLTTPNLSVKWGFDAARKHWKESIIGECNQAYCKIRES